MNVREKGKKKGTNWWGGAHNLISLLNLTLRSTNGLLLLLYRENREGRRCYSIALKREKK